MKNRPGPPLALSRARLLGPAAALAFFMGAAVLISAPGSPFTPHQKAAYLSAKDVAFVRPGLVIKVTGAEIAQDGTIKARFKLTDPRGLPLDRAGVTTPGAVSVSFIAAYIPKDATQYVAYTTRPQTSPITNVTAVQASTDSGGAFAQVAEGEYTYTFKTKAPSSIDRTVTHTIGAYGSRSLAEFDLGTQYDDDVYNFVPDGSAVKVVRDVVGTASCNQCHHDMGFHGGSRKTMELCVLCHTPQTIDPDTGNSVDMPVMVHKIHQGAGLPSVKAGTPYKIIGHQQSVNDYSEINFPTDVRNCQMCHQPGKTTQADNVFKPTRAACGACHDDVNFATGEKHANLPQPTDSQCANCHIKQGETEFDASILGAHTVPTQAKVLPGVIMNIVSVANATPGSKPAVTFTIKDKAGNPIHPSKMARLNFRFAGATTDYTTMMSEDARKADGTDGTYVWNFSAPVPAEAKGTWALSLEGRTEIKVQPGTVREQTVRDTGMNKTVYVTVDGKDVVPRRQVVATEKCNVCHFQLKAHGDARNQVENCVLCHNPTATAGKDAEAQPIDFAVMIHKIHRGKELTRPYFSFQEVGYPGIQQNCDACHVNNSQQLPLNENLASVKNPNGFIDPMMKTGAACTACHDTRAAASHVLSNTTAIGEACAACHGPNSEYSVNKSHAR